MNNRLWKLSVRIKIRFTTDVNLTCSHFPLALVPSGPAAVRGRDAAKYQKNDFCVSEYYRHCSMTVSNTQTDEQSYHDVIMVRLARNWIHCVRNRIHNNWSWEIWMVMSVSSQWEPRKCSVNTTSWLILITVSCRHLLPAGGSAHIQVTGPRPPAPTPATYTAATGRAESQLSAATQQPSTVTSHDDAAETAQPRVRRLQAEPLLHHQLGADQQGRVPQHGPEGGQGVSSEEIAVTRQ